MNVFTKMKKSLFLAALMIPVGNVTWGQTYGFEDACSNYSYSFQNGCIPGWFSTSGTPDTDPLLGAAYQGNRYAHMYAKFDGGCVHPEGSEGIALNYNFQAGATYKITYASKGGVGGNPGSQTYTANWILTNGLSNQSGGSCTTGEITPNIPAGSQTIGTPALNNAVWSSNQHTFTASANFSQLWFRHIMTSSVLNSTASVHMMLDEVTIERICTITPSLLAANSFCAGAPITLVGGSTPSDCPVDNHVWTVVETDQFGNVIPNAVEWWSPWVAGGPSMYTIPSVANGGPTMTCGKYYRVNLAVQNTYTPWAAVSKFIYINCPPGFKTKGTAKEICTGGSVGLTVTMDPGSNSTYTMDIIPISPAGPSIYTGPLASVVASPTVTTTYQLTVTDNVTGCSTTKQGIITVINNDPSFSLFVNTANPNYFTATLYANDLNANSIPGFYYQLIIEELDGSLNGYYQNNGTDCWWNYPNPETFKGYVSNGTGTFNQTPWGACSQPAGQFLYNHMYRITRVVWNEKCGRNQFSMIIMPVKSGNGHEVVVYEDTNAPDYTNFSLGTAENSLRNENTVEIYPNPGTGLYTISLTESTNVNIAIYNLLGEKVREIEPKGTSTTFDLTGFPKGVYLVKIQSETEQVSKKIILE
ncbi:hypothetical protein D3C71_770300 [compost metagenome]